MRFARYGDTSEKVTLDELIQIQRDDQCLWAHAENSGSESTYVEVARWNDDHDRWEKFCFLKCMDDRLPGKEDFTDRETAVDLAQMITNPDEGLCDVEMIIVKPMPTFGEMTEMEKLLLNELRGILTSVEDGNVTELRPCGALDSIRQAIAKAEGKPVVA